MKPSVAALSPQGASMMPSLSHWAVLAGPRRTVLPTKTLIQAALLGRKLEWDDCRDQAISEPGQ
jgi:hypothetical protein